MATAELPLPCGCVALIDAEDLHLVKGFKWSLGRSRPGRRNRYVIAHPFIAGRQHDVVLHRLITDAPPGVLVDHRDGNTLDNRRANLRLVDHAGNSRNRGPNTGRRFKGVSFHRMSGKWQARCAAGRDRRQIGLFADAEQAARAYDRVAAEMHGEYARLNFPREGW